MPTRRFVTLFSSYRQLSTGFAMPWRKDGMELHCLQWLDMKARYGLKLPAIARYNSEDVRNLMAMKTALSIGHHASDPLMRTGRPGSSRL